MGTVLGHWTALDLRLSDCDAAIDVLPVAEGPRAATIAAGASALL